MKIDDILLSILLKFNIGVMPFLNPRHGAMCIYYLAKRIQIRDEPPTIGRVKPKFKTIYDAQQYFIEGLALSGPKKAKILCESGNFDNPFELIKSVIDSEVLYTKTGNPKGIAEDDKMNIKGFGPQFVLKNKELLEK